MVFQCSQQRQPIQPRFFLSYLGIAKTAFSMQFGSNRLTALWIAGRDDDQAIFAAATRYFNWRMNGQARRQFVDPAFADWDTCFGLTGFALQHADPNLALIFLDSAIDSRVSGREL